jgi:hypothetical protein
LSAFRREKDAARNRGVTIMVNINDAYPDKYLKADDLKGQEIPVVITRADIEEIGQNKDRKIVLYFKDRGKAMVCNKTNARRIAFAYGPESQAWVGKTVVVFPEMVDYKGQPTWALRIKLPANVMQQMAQAPAGAQFDERNPPPPDAAPF